MKKYSEKQNFVKKLDKSEMQGSYLLTICGVIDLITRVPLGYLVDNTTISKHYILAGNILNMGIAIYTYTFASSYKMAIMSSVYLGSFSGLYGALTVSSLRDLTKVNHY